MSRKIHGGSWPGISVEGGPEGILWAALVLGLVNALVRPVLATGDAELTIILVVNLFAILLRNRYDRKW